MPRSQSSTAMPLTPAERRDVTINDRALLIYTSGTTGLPKAASISHRRILNWGGWFAGLTGASPDDRLYDCLPVYHSVGGVVAPCSMLFAGASVVLAEKFSATQFLAGHRALRLHAVPVYRRALPLSAESAGVRVRTPASAAARLRQRPARRHLGGIPGALCDPADSRILRGDRRQFLALQCRGQGRRDRPHSRRCWRIAFRPRSSRSIPTAARRYAATMVFASPARAMKPGEAIGRIGTADEGGGRFEGYTDNAETEKKILRDVVRQGRRLVPHRRSDAARRAGLLPFRRSRRRHLPLEGRERRDQRGQ